MADSAHFLPGLDWLIKLGLGLIVAAAGVLLIRPLRRDGWRFAIGIFTIEPGALVAVRGIVAGGGSRSWEYLVPFALVRVPGSFTPAGLTHLDNFFLPGADELGVAYQIFEAALVGVIFGAVRLRMNAIWPVMIVHAAYDLILVLAFGHAFPVAPTVPGFLVATVVNLGLAAVGLFLLRAQPATGKARLEAA